MGSCTSTSFSQIHSQTEPDLSATCALVYLGHANPNQERARLTKIRFKIQIQTFVSFQNNFKLKAQRNLLAQRKTQQQKLKRKQQQPTRRA
jgi:hypothetical protein